MDTVAEQRQQSEPELHLLSDLASAGGRVRWREAAVGSVVAHIVLAILLSSLPSGLLQIPKRPEVARNVTPLVAPPFELTQPNPNKGKISKSINMESLMPRPNVQTPKPALSTTRPAASTDVSLSVSSTTSASRLTPWLLLTERPSISTSRAPVT